MDAEDLDTVVFVLAVLVQIINVFFWTLHLIALLYGKYLFSEKRTRRETLRYADLPGVSILKPLKGVDDNLLENLTSYFYIDYPNYELIFCVQDAHDPVIDLVKNLIEKYPIIDAKLYYGSKTVCANPKISNLCQGYPHAKYDLILISDSGIKSNALFQSLEGYNSNNCIQATKDALYDMVSCMGGKVGLVHQMPYCCDRPRRSNILEKIYFGGWQARNYLFINFLGMNCVVGMSCLMKKSVIDEYGGLTHFGQYIAEDFFIAKAFLDKGYKVVISHEPAWQNSAQYSASIWRARVIRWTQLRLRFSGPSWLEPFADCFLQGLYSAWSFYYLFSFQAAVVYFVSHIFIWYINDYMMIQILEKGRFKHGIMSCLPVWLYRETICYVLFLRGACNPYVKWRSGRYKLKFGGKGVRADKKPASRWRLWKTSPRVESQPENGFIQREIRPDGSVQQRFGASISTICDPKLYSFKFY